MVIGMKTGQFGAGLMKAKIFDQKAGAERCQDSNKSALQHWEAEVMMLVIGIFANFAFA